MLAGWGSNRWNQLGSNFQSSSSQSLEKAKLEPSLILENERFVDISAGEGHSLLVSETGDLIACGRGTEGQLGHGNKSKMAAPRVVDRLQGEVIVDCAAGAMHSLAVTAAGKVYIWGLIHVTAAEQKKRDKAAAAAVATKSKNSSLLPSSDASDYDNHNTAVDEVDDRTDSESGGEDSEESADIDAAAAAGGDARQMLGLTGQASDKLLRIVMESTEKWMTASDAPTQRRRGEGFNDQEAAEEEEAEERAAKMEKERATERGEAGDLGMMKMDMLAQRRPVVIPTMVTGPLAKERVISVSAGFGHSLALTEKGTVFSSGYNDRGQLGLGHRVNCPTFQPITALDGRVVVQIACGSQHNLLRVLSLQDRELGECWVFGNGALGQLGLGRKVTGRRTPVHLPLLVEDSNSNHSVLMNVIDVAAGSNHSVCVCRTEDGKGGVFSWGHGEYGQHGGQQSLGSHDLVDSFYYYSPRRLLPQNANDVSTSVTTTTRMSNGGKEEDDCFVSAACGSCFTIGLTSRGNVWSWGWNAYGVLGRGSGLVSHAPMPIQTLGGRADREATKLAVGGNHCLVLVSSSAAARAILLRPLLNHILQPSPVNPTAASSPPLSLSALSVSASAESTSKIEGQVSSEENEDDEEDESNSDDTALCDVSLLVQGTKLLAHRIVLESRCSYFRGLFRAVENDVEPSPSPESQKDEKMSVKQAMKKKKKTKLEVSIDSEFATAATVKALLVYLYTDVLECPPHRIDLLRKLASEYHLDRLVGLCVSSLGFRYEAVLDNSDKSFGIPKSSFEEDMHDAVNSKKFADVLLYDSSQTSSGEFGEDRQIWAHQCLLTHVEYFNTLLNGKYKEGGKTSKISSNTLDEERQGESDMSFMLNKQQHLTSGDIIEIDISGLIQDGLNFATLLRLIRFVYTGSSSCVPRNDPNAITELAAAAERFGVITLVKLCERILVSLIDDVENAHACIDFAQRYNLKRLDKHCSDILAAAVATTTVSVMKDC